jgi:hypothetical protein
VCPDPEVFGAMLNLDGPPKFKATKMAADDFQEIIGNLRVSIRYVFSVDTYCCVDDLWFNVKGTTYFISLQM